MADMLLSTANGTSSVVQKKLLEAVRSKSLRNFEVDSFGAVTGKGSSIFMKINELDSILVIVRLGK